MPTEIKVPLKRSSRSLNLRTCSSEAKGNGVRWKQASVSSSSAGQRRYWYLAAGAYDGNKQQRGRGNKRVRAQSERVNGGGGRRKASCEAGDRGRGRGRRQEAEAHQG